MGPRAIALLYPYAPSHLLLISGGGVAISVVPVWCGPSATAGGSNEKTSVVSASGVAARPPDPEDVFRLLLSSGRSNLFTRTVLSSFVDN